MYLHEYYKDALVKIDRDLQELGIETIVKTNKEALINNFKKKYFLSTLKIIDQKISRNTNVSLKTFDVTLYYFFEIKDNICKSLSCKSLLDICEITNIEKNFISFEFSTLPDKLHIKICDLDKQLRITIDIRNLYIKKGNEIINNYIIKRIKDINEHNSQFEEIIKKVSINLEIVNENKIPIIAKETKKEEIDLIPKTMNYYWSENTINKIIYFLMNTAKFMERAPKVFSKLEEEDLRDILLAILNSIFPGKATGETFSKKGKSDIYLVFNQNNIFLAECKIWKGEQNYSKSIDQIFNYLTLNENYGIIITFIKNNNWSDLIVKASKASQGNQHFKKNGKEFKFGFITHNIFSEDQTKTLILYHCFCNLFTL